MRSARTGVPPSVLELRRVLAEALVRAQLDLTGPVSMLNAFLNELRPTSGLTAQGARRLWEEFAQAAAPEGHFLELYMHFPYCRSRCLYCFTSSRAAPGQSALRRYVENAREEAVFFAPAFQGRTFRSWSVGGGTPSLLDAAGLRRWLAPVARLFSFEDKGLRSVELNPASTDGEKLAALRSLGFNRLSFGVQTFNAQLLRAVKRESQDYGMVRRAIRRARQAGFDYVNADLLLGLMGEPASSFLESFRLLAALRPSTIIISSLILTDAYMRSGGVTREQYLRHASALLPQAREGLARLAAETGYRPVQFGPQNGTWIFRAEEVAKRRFQQWERSSPDGQWASSTLGLGEHSRSHLFGRAIYDRKPRAFAQAVPLYALSALSAKEEMAQHIVYSLDHYCRIDDVKFRRRFGADVRTRFALELRALQALGKIREDEAGFAFLPTGSRERILYGLFFLMDTVEGSPFSGGKPGGALRRRLERELGSMSLEREARDAAHQA